MKTVLINFVICRNSQGGNGWQDTPQFRAEAQQLIDRVNTWYGDVQPAGYALTCGAPAGVQDTRIRFKLNQIYFLNSDAWNAEPYGTGQVISNILAYVFSTYPGSEKAMNHIFAQPGTWPAGYGWGHYSTSTVPGYGSHSYVFTRNSMWGASPLWTPLDDHTYHLAHEYGHALGLHHTYDGPEAGAGRAITHYDFLSDVFGTCPEPAMSNSGSPCYNGCNPTANHVCHLTSCFFNQFPNYRPLMSSGGNEKFISRKQAGRMHRALSFYDNSFTLDNRTMHQYVEETHSIGTHWITEDETWDFAIKMYEDIIVTAGKTLTIKCEVRMPVDGIVEVRPGGRLIVDGGTITCAHPGKMWRGIIADGTSYQHQEPANNPTFQGLVVLKNGALIEHADIGFANNRFGTPNERGGVLMVQGTITDPGATFRNCRRGAEYMKYRNFYPNNPATTKNDNSYFRHAIFEVNDDYRGATPFDAHVRLNEVRGIAFSQCDFSNGQATGGIVHGSADLGVGIFSLDASFSVTAMCSQQLPPCEYGSGQPEPVCPQASLKPSRFIGLDHGIRATTSGIGGYTYTVKDSYFENNVCGIYTDGVNNAAILRNKFVIGGRDVVLNGLDDLFQEKHRGIYHNNANAFKIEENRFSKPSIYPARSEGVVVSNTAAYNNQVYKNTAAGVHFGYIGENANVDPVHPTKTGLSFICNQNVQNGEEDFEVRSSFANPGSDHCIKIFQGSSAVSAGNTFTPQQNGSSPYYNYHNKARVLPITYFWELPPGDLNAGAYNIPWVQRNAIASPHNTCPTRILCGGGTGPVKEALMPQIAQERTAYLNLKYVYESLLDGGDFDELKETIMHSWPQDAWALRNELMAKSPYLSTDILKEAGLKNILPHAMYLEVCLANPEATQRDGFTKWLQYEMPNPLPEYMVAQVFASWNQRTWRTSLEADMGWHNGEYQRLNDELTTAMLNDTVAQPADSLLARWQLNPSLRARFGEVNVLLEQNRFDEAVALLQGLDADYLLEKQGMQDRNDMLDLITAIRPVIDGGRTLMQLEPGELAAMEGIATRQPSLASSYARNTLCYGYNICMPPVTGGANQPKMALALPAATSTATTPSLLAHPNPASTWVAFSHTLPGKVDQARIRIVDPLGRVVNEMAIGASPGQEIWDTRGTAPGSYLVELYNAGRLVGAQRVVVNP
ncbi:MAG: hypothetical protein JSS84_00285 [Bacteroidetes bacterium]|nr:hypothetical protein [Bacteroidota bacterium]